MGQFACWYDVNKSLKKKKKTIYISLVRKSQENMFSLSMKSL